MTLPKDGARGRIAAWNGGWVVYILLLSWAIQDKGSLADTRIRPCDTCFCGTHCSTILNLNISNVSCNSSQVNLILKYRPDYKCRNDLFVKLQRAVELKCPGVVAKGRPQCNFIGDPALEETILLVLLTTVSGVNLLKTVSR